MRYSLESTPTTSRPQILTDNDTLFVLAEYNPMFADYYHSAKKRGSIRVEKDGSDIELTFAFEQAWKKRSESVRRETATHAYMAFTALANFNDYHDSASPLEMTMSTERLHDDARLGMNATLKRPKGKDRDIAAFTTNHMRNMARQLRYPEAKSHIVDSLVFAAVSKEYGVTLCVNDVGSCSLDTDGSHYQPFNPRIELFSHNIYSPEMQLICATGAIALAHYNELRS